MKTIKNTLLLAFALLSITATFAQDDDTSGATFDIGADIVSRYIWRGINLGGASPAIQPYAELATGDFTLGAWASYTTGGQNYGQEFDIYAGYAFGNFSLGFTDYTFPDDFASNPYFNINNHVGEAMLSYGDDSITLMAAVNVYGDDDNSIYAEIGVPFTIGETELGLTLGAANGGYYTSEDFAIINIGLSASKDIKITETFSVGAGAATIFNPDTDEAYLVFSLSL